MGLIKYPLGVSKDMEIIRVEGLVKRFGDKTALDDLSFSVEEGTFFGCFGPNGAGKSTLLKVLTGQLPPSRGRTEVLGLETHEQGVEIRRRVGIVPEVESPPSYLTAREFLFFVGKVRRVDDLETRIERWIDFFDLHDAQGSLCKDLSKGTRQKVMLASAFLHEPALLFLDEPFVNLDPIYQHKLKDYLSGLPRQGRTVFLCSHILEIAQKLCQEMIILNRGRVVARGSVSEMTAHEDLESVFLRLVGGDVPS